MSGHISTIRQTEPPADLEQQLPAILDRNAAHSQPIDVFFRADDIAIVDDAFVMLMQLFQKHNAPLCLAVVPDWINRQRWQDMEQFTPGSRLWCWHQHGYSHKNHEPSGKKGEFGDNRKPEEIRHDLETGKNRLAKLLGPVFYPVFTPPWNRCNAVTLELLQSLEFKAVSRSRGSKPDAAGGLPDLFVNVDLHTRKEDDFRLGWKNLMREFTLAAKSGRMGVMIHHQRMNHASFLFLDMLLKILKEHAGVTTCTFRELL